MHTHVQNGRKEKMLRWILIIANALVTLAMLLSAGVASDEGDAKTFSVLLALTFLSLFNAAYILFE